MGNGWLCCRVREEMKITIPDAALDAGLAAANALDPYYVNRDQLRAAFNAMVDAWPGMWAGPMELGEGKMLILPLTENQDD